MVEMAEPATKADIFFLGLLTVALWFVAQFGYFNPFDEQLKRIEQKVNQCQP